MLISYNWIKEYVNHNLNCEELAQQLTLYGLEVASIKKVGKVPNGVVVGKILSIDKHPNADRLKIVQVQTKTNTHQVVCGASNIATDKHILLATVGCILPSLTIAEQKIRGLLSCGMICAKSELGLASTKDENDKSEVWLLPKEASIDSMPSDFFVDSDFVLELELASNRPDCFSIVGIAREIAAFTDTSFVKAPTSHRFKETSNIKVNIHDNAQASCHRYCAMFVNDVVINHTDDVMQNRLHHLGFTAINNIVDITNYVLLEEGQPLHAFDYDKIEGSEINVRFAKKGETLIALNGKNLTLDEDDLVIADKKKPIALAGVIGGMNSQVDDNTKRILLEGAYFTNQQVRRTSRRHGITTSSSLLFERGVCFQQLHHVMERTATLISESLNRQSSLTNSYASFAFKDMVSTNKARHHHNPSITLQLKNVEDKLGVALLEDNIKSLLHKLGFILKAHSANSIQCEPPIYRADVHHEWDVIEEIARLYGYQNIPETYAYPVNAQLDIANYQENIYLQLALSLGYYQVYNLSFVEKAWVQQPSLQANKHLLVPIKNPLSPEFSHLRDYHLFGMLKNLKLNLERTNHGFNKCFEYGIVFSAQQADDHPYLEEEMIAFLGTGNIELPNWNTTTRPYDLYDLKGDVYNYLQRLQCDKFLLSVNKKELAIFDSNMSLEISYDNVIIGKMGLIAENLLQYFDIKNHIVYYADIYLNRLKALAKKENLYQTLSIYPSIHRDVAMVVAEDYCIEPIIKVVETAHEWIKNVQVTNCYADDKIGKSKMSVVFNVELCSNQKTLTKTEADKIIDLIVKNLKKEYSFDLR